MSRHVAPNRQLGFHNTLILIVFLHDARHYNSVWREICAKTVVCFDQSALSGRRAVAVGTSNDRAARRPDNTMLLIPCGICATGIRLLGTCDEGQE